MPTASNRTGERPLQDLQAEYEREHALRKAVPTSKSRPRNTTFLRG